VGKLGSLVGLSVCVLAMPQVAAAATCTWTGGGTNSNWSTAANWNNCGGAHALPANNDTVILPAGANRPTQTDDIAGLTLNSVQINGFAAGNTRYTVQAGAGVSLTLNGVLQFNAPPDGLSSGPLFNVPITLSASSVISNIGTAVALVNNTVNLNGFPVILAPSSANLTFAGTISGAGTITKNAPQTLFLEAPNTFTGQMQINAGTVRVRTNTALGAASAGTTVATGANLVLEFGISIAEPLTLAGGVLSSGTGAEIANGPVTLTAASSMIAQTGTILTVSGPISGAFNLTKLGAGALILSGASPAFTGVTVAQTGVLEVDGSLANSSINVTGATLDGIGTVGPILAASGAVSPGGSVGVLHSGNVSLNTGVSFAIGLTGATPGTQYTQLAVTGTVNLSNATLLTALTFTPVQNSVFTIIDNDGTDPIVGTFNGLAEGASLTISGKPFVISYVGGDGNDVTLATRIPALYYLSEGATGPFFDEDVLIANPNTTAALVALTFLTPSGSPIVQGRTLPAQSRTTIHVDQIAGLEGAEVSTIVTSSSGLPLAVERSMFWDSTYYAGHTGSSVELPSQDWVFAEGSQGFFNTYVLLANANGTPADATLTFLREADTPIVKTVTVPAAARLTIDCGTIPEIVNRSFGITVHGSQPIIAERAMYFGTTPTRLFSGGHESAGVTSPSRSWFLAEGATGGFFDTFVLLSNPQSTTATVTVKFLLDTGETITETKVIPGNQRLTINIEAEPDPRLKNAAVSTVIDSDVPIVAERSMYWIGDIVPWTESHNSFGVVDAGTHWGLAEGRVGQSLNFHTYILLANPQTSAAAVTVTFLRENGGAPIVKTFTVAPTSRFNIDVNNVSTDLQNETVSADIRVTNGVPIVVERSMYWDSGGVLFKGGTNATGVRLP
jgi:autotransporter-associated beta strand protein